MPEQAILDGLNPEQRRAVEAVRGPVCILAGAGSGKTTTITHRVANQVETGAFRSDEILAVTRPTIDATWLEEELGELERLVAEGETLELVSRLGSMLTRPRRAVGVQTETVS